MLPESPINILAGLKLCHKKPKVLPNIINVSNISNPLALLITRAIIPIVKKYIEDSPPASPSNPSIKFIQLITETINKIVIGILNIPKLIYIPKALISCNTIPP